MLVSGCLSCRGNQLNGNNRFSFLAPPTLGELCHINVSFGVAAMINVSEVEVNQLFMDNYHLYQMIGESKTIPDNFNAKLLGSMLRKAELTAVLTDTVITFHKDTKVFIKFFQD